MLPIFKYSPSSYSSYRFFRLTISSWRCGVAEKSRAVRRSVDSDSCQVSRSFKFVFPFLFLVLASCGMFRASLRSASDPLRNHVCLSCLSHRFGAPSRLRQFHARPALRVEASNDSPKNKPEDASVPPNPSQEMGLPTEVQCQQSWITQGNVTIILT
jgi:hypothetical protein